MFRRMTCDLIFEVKQESGEVGIEEAYKDKVKRELGRLAQKVPHLLRNSTDFDMMETIGKGGFGEVYLAYHRQDKVLCAFKLIYPERLKGRQFRHFIDEVVTMARCHSQFVLPLFGYIIEPPYAIITPFMKGGTLADAITNKNDPLTPTQLTKIAMGIALGMAHIHAMDIYHRDLKTGNVLLDENKLPKICDFGIARMIKDDNAPKTQKIGTPIAMAPELFSSTTYTKSVDVYAYAILLYEMIYKIKPYKGIKITEFQRRVLINGERIALSPSTPEGLRHIVSHAWKQNPAKRPSFLDIYKFFASGKAAFKGTDPTEIALFAERNREELLAIEKINKSKRKKATLNSNTGSGSSYDQSKSSNTPKEPIDVKVPNSQLIKNEEESEIQIQEEPKQEKLIEEGKEEVKVEKEKASPRKRRLSKAKRVRRKSSAGKKSHRTKALNEKVLEEKENKTEPTEDDYSFVKQLNSYATSLSVKQFKAFSKSVSNYVMKHQNSFVFDSLLQAGLALMKQSREMLLEVSESNFFTQIPVEFITNFDNLVNVVCVVMVNNPKCVNENYSDLIRKSLMESTIKTLITISFPAKNNNISKAVFDILISQVDHFVDNEYAVQYIAILLEVLKSGKFESDLIIQTIIKFLKSNDINTVNAAFCALIDANIDRSKAELFDPIHFSSLIPKTPFAVSLLLRRPEIASTSVAVGAIIGEIPRNEIAWDALFEVAVLFPRLVVENDAWFGLAASNARFAFRVFLAAFGTVGVRASFMRSPKYIEFLNVMANSGDNFILSAIPSIIRRQGMTPAFVRELSNTGFITAYLRAGLRENTIDRNNNCLVLIDTVIRIEFIPDVMIFMGRIVELLGVPELFNSALSVIHLLSFFKQTKEALRGCGLVEYFKKLRKFKEYKDISSSILKNIC